MGEQLLGELRNRVRPLILLGLDYLSLNRAGNTLSIGELQRLQLTRTLRNETTGVLCILDEPSIGLHPSNMEGLFSAMYGLLEQGNSLVVVDHDLDILQKAEWLIEIGPGAGKNGGLIVASGSVEQVTQSRQSIIAPYLHGDAKLLIRHREQNKELFSHGKIHIEISNLYNLNNVKADFPLGHLTAVTGLSGSGKTALILESLVPELIAKAKGQELPPHIVVLENARIRRVNSVDAVPVGKNDRSTVATYSGIFDYIRILFAGTEEAKQKQWRADRFSYNSSGTGELSLDIQYMPNIDMVCPECGGKRYNAETRTVRW